MVRGDRTLTPLMREAPAGYFEMLGVSPLIGRALLSEDTQSGGKDVVVLAHGFWQEELGGSEDILGSVLELDRHPYAVEPGKLPSEPAGRRQVALV